MRARSTAAERSIRRAPPRARITKSGSGILHFTGAGTYAVPLSASGSISFEQAGGDAGNYTSTISGGCTVTKSNSGTIILSGTNNYTGTTIVSDGALQANSGVGLPNGSFLNLAGGVIQSNGTATVTFSRTLGSSGSNKFRFSGSGGGFAAGAGPMTVKINSGTSTITWGTSSTNIAGTLKFGSSTAANTVTLQNGINLAGATRTIEVDDNPNSTADRAEISGVITYGSGTAGITKTGDGLLVLSATNTYNGTTTISGGALQVDEGVGLPAGKMLVLDGGVLQNNSADHLQPQPQRLSMDGQRRRLFGRQRRDDRQHRRRQGNAQLGRRRRQRHHGNLEIRLCQRPTTALPSKTASISTAARARSRSTATPPR